MTHKEQNKILDAKTESNVNQYKVDRLNAEISAFSSGDLNKYEYLKRIDLNYKPNALDKARFKFSPLGKTFSMGLDKTAQGYQEEGIMKLLKDIRDSLAGGITPKTLGGPRPDLDRADDDDDDDDDNDDDDDDDMSDLETEEEAALNKFKDKIDNFDEMFRNKENEFNKSFKDKENKLNTKLNKLNNDVKKINNYIKENNDKINNKEKEYNNLLLKYNEINRALNKTKDELYRARNDIDEQKTIQEKLNYQINEAEELKSKLNEKKEDIDNLKTYIKNSENIDKINNVEIEKLKKSDDKVFTVLNKFKNNMENKMSYLDKIVTSKENEWNTKLNKLNNDAKKNR